MTNHLPFSCSRSSLAIGSALLLLTIGSGCGQAPELGPVANSAASAKIREAFGSTGGEPSGGSTVAAVSTGTGWGTLQGRFTYDGSPPAMRPYAANKDAAICAPGGKAPPQETLLVDSSTSGIANIAIFVRKTARVHQSAQPTVDSIVFDQKSCVFLSHLLPLTIGQTMEIKNSDNVGHNTNISGKNSFNQTVPAGSSLDFKPQKEEAVPQAVRCSIHPWMVAYYLPRKNGYFAITAPDGTFEIPNLPAGEELEFQVWHESATGPGGALVLATPEAKPLKWSGKGRFKIQLEPDGVKKIDLTVPSTALGG